MNLPCIYALKFFHNLWARLDSAAALTAVVSVNMVLSKLESIHVMEYYAAIKRNEAELYALL